MKTSKELIAANLTKEEVRDLIGADSLEFLSVEGLKEAVGFDFPTPNNGIALDIFTGNYVEGLGNYKEEFEAELTDIQKEYLKKGSK